MSKAKLYAKMCQVMAQTEKLPKLGRNKHFNYDYVRDEDVLEAMRHALANVGLALFVSMTGVAREGERDKKAIVDLEITLCDSETGETLTADWRAEATDLGDKGINKAVTAGIKYWLLKTFLIGTGDVALDADSDKETTDNKKAETKPEQKQDVVEFDVNNVNSMTWENNWGKMLADAFKHLPGVTDVDLAKKAIKKTFEKVTVLQAWEFLRDEYKESVWENGDKEENH